MQSPFPSMDPYLEAPAGWVGVHSRLINAISEELADRIMPSFLVTIEERVYVLDLDSADRRPLVPDVTALTTIYQRGHYADLLAYDTSVPSPPLDPSDARWAAQLVQEKRST